MCLTDIASNGLRLRALFDDKYSWVAPTGVTKVSVVAIGNGKCGGTGNCTICVSGLGGGGGGLGYKNNISVTPGTGYTVVVGSAGNNRAGSGAVRIIYPGATRSFPSTNTGNL